MAYSVIKKPSDYFNTKLYTGNGTDATGITGVGFQPDWVWIKERSSTSPHKLLDAVRGATKELESNSTNAEATEATSLQSFDSDGFTVGTNGAVNENSQTYASWNWLANGTGSANTDGSISSTVSASATSGFSIVSYTGTGATGTIGHGLGAKPDLMIVKSRQDADAWLVGSDKISGWNWTNDYLHLNATSAKMTDAGGTAFNTAPTSSLFTVGSYLNGSGENYIAYMFTSIKGFSKIGTYTGNGSTDGTFVYLGFKPAFVLTKNASSTSEWHIYDNKRDTTNPNSNVLSPNANYADSISSNCDTDFLSNGFKLRNNNSNRNESGSTHIYMAFAEEPLVGDNPATAR